MKVLRRYNQHRRDLDIDVECENCGQKETITTAYDDRNYWDNVVPAMKCRNCGKSTKDIGAEVDFMPTRYSEGQQV